MVFGMDKSFDPPCITSVIRCFYPVASRLCSANRLQLTQATASFTDNLLARFKRPGVIVQSPQTGCEIIFTEGIRLNALIIN